MQIDNTHLLKLSQDLDKIKNTAMEIRGDKVYGLIDSLDPHFRKMQPKAKEIQNLKRKIVYVDEKNKIVKK